VKHQTKKAVHGHRKRQGEHQKRTGHFLKVYTPYIPIITLIFLSVWLIKPQTSSIKQTTKSEVLAYATDIAGNSLINSTNQKRTAAGVGALTYNDKLTKAAQSKANDMATRDYWSHNTPEGTPPWTFISNAGYSYTIAGENLAFGYRITNTNPVTNEIGVIDGWMASPTHKDNLLNSRFTEVGFGIANSPSYQNQGQQTIVVAMYASPIPPAAAPAVVKPATTIATTATAATPAPTSEIQATIDQNDTTKSSSTSTPPTLTPEPKSISRIEATTNKSMPWLLSTLFVISLSGGILLITKHGYAVHQYVTKGKKFFLKNKLLDVTIVAFVIFYAIASQIIIKVL
jgi:uncharacterized protein YkwD